MAQGDIRIDTREIKDLERRLHKMGSPHIYREAAQRAGTRDARQANTRVRRAIAKRLNITQREIAKDMRHFFDPGTLTSYVSVTSRARSLKRYGARLLKRAGVIRYRIYRGGPDIDLRHAFIIDKRGGHVFERAGRGAPRSPVDILFGPSIAAAMNNPADLNRLGEAASAGSEVLLLAEISRQITLIIKPDSL